MKYLSTGTIVFFADLFDLDSFPQVCGQVGQRLGGEVRTCVEPSQVLAIRLRP